MLKSNLDEFRKVERDKEVYFQEGNAQRIRERLRSYKPRLRSRRIALIFQFLTASRVSEIVGKYFYPINNYVIANYGDEKALLFNMKTAKRMGREKFIAIPLNPKYEPFSQEILEYFEAKKKRGSKKAFSFSTRTLQNHAEDCFKGLNYIIEQRGEINRHQRKVLTHGLRHFRATELVMNYGFDSIDLAIFCGWTLRTATGLGIADRYVSYQWQRYFPKLLKPYAS